MSTGPWPAAAVGRLLEGRVTAFDDEAGLGMVEAEGGGDFPFHCVAIADGSRLVAPGTAVRFRVAPGLPGSWEVRELSRRFDVDSPRARPHAP